MKQKNNGVKLKRPVIKIGVVVAATAVMSAGAASLLGGSSGAAMMPYALAAAIDDSNTTVGFADSNIIGESTADMDQTLDEMQSLGVENVRILIPWNNVEPAPGVWNWTTVDALVDAANARGMGIMGVLNSTPAWAVPAGDPAVATPPANDTQYAAFASAVASRYAGKVSAYEVWNEPNAATFWYPAPNPAAYTQLLQAAYPAIKAADPSATVVGGVVGWVTDSPGLAISPAEYIQDMYNDGAKGYFDALSYHPYEYQVPFSQGTAYGSASPIDQLELMHQEMVAEGDGSKQIWATEYGEPTSVASQATQASYISNFLTSWSSFSYTGPAFIYTTRDVDTGSTSAQDTLGVFETDWTPKLAASVIAAWTAAHPQEATDPPADPPSTLTRVATMAAATEKAAGTATGVTMAATADVASATMTAAGDAMNAGLTAASTLVASAAGATGSSSGSSSTTPTTAAKPAVAATATKTATNPASSSASASKQASATSTTSTTPATSATSATSTTTKAEAATSTTSTAKTAAQK